MEGTKVRCTGRSKRSGDQCRKWAVRGKDKCRFHGGATPVKHGLDSKYTSGTLGSRIEAALEDPDLLSLKRQVAVVTALQQHLLDHCPEEIAGGMLISKNDDETVRTESLPDFVDSVRKVTESVGKLVAAHEKLQQADENMVPLAVVGELIDRIFEAVNRHVHDPAAQRSILDALAVFTDLQAPRVLPGVARAH